jgi:hypothetical protein
LAGAARYESLIACTVNTVVVRQNVEAAGLRTGEIIKPIERQKNTPFDNNHENQTPKKHYHRCRRASAHRHHG